MNRSVTLTWITIMTAAAAAMLGCDRANPAAEDADAADKPRASVDSQATGTGTPALETSGSKTAEASSSDGNGPVADSKAASLIKQMIAAHRDLKTYAGQGQYVLSFPADGTMIRVPVNVWWRMKRPGQVYFRAGRPLPPGDKVRSRPLYEFRIHVAADGEKLHGRLEHPMSYNFDQQVVDRTQPQKLTSTDIYSVTEWVDVTQPKSRFSVLAWASLDLSHLQVSPLGLLLDEKPLADLLEKKKSIALLDDGKVGDAACRRVKIAGPRGAYVLWIDAASHLLRRVDYPTAEVAQQLNPAIDREKITLSLQVTDVEVNKSLDDDTFHLQTPDDSQSVLYFVQPPPILPSPLLGRKVPDFEFTDLDGKSVTRDDLAGRVTVLVWYSDGRFGEPMLKLLDRLRQSLKSEKQLRIFAVNGQLESVGSEEIAKRIQRWGVETEVLRDLKSYAARALGVQMVGTVVVLDPKSRMQGFAEADEAQAALEMTLQPFLARLLKDSGANPAGEMRKQYESLQQKYIARLNEARVADAVVATPPTDIAAAKPPTRLRLTKAWVCRDIEAPGNLLVVPSEAGPQIYVNDGLHRVARLTPDGKVAERLEPELPRDAAMSFLTTAIGGGRRYFAGAAAGGRQVIVFDAHFKPLMRYPADEDRSDKIAVQDTLLLQLDESPQPELVVGFGGIGGVHAADLTGKRLWGNRQVANVSSVSRTPGKEQRSSTLLVTSLQGSVTRLSAEGESQEPLQVARRAIHELQAAKKSGGKTVFCGLSYLSKNRLLIVGLDADLRPHWEYPLPDGIYTNQMQHIAWGRLLPGDAAHWIAGAPDGSIHIVADDGSFSDYFNTGDKLTGLAVLTHGKERRLLVSTTTSIVAWDVE